MKRLILFPLIIACSLFLGHPDFAFAEQETLLNQGQPTIQVIVQAGLHMENTRPASL